MVVDYLSSSPTGLDIRCPPNRGQVPPPIAATRIRSCDCSRRMVWTARTAAHTSAARTMVMYIPLLLSGVGAYLIGRVCTACVLNFSENESVYAVGDIQPSRAGK